MDDLERTYRANEQRWRRLEDEARFILDDALHASAIKVHSLVSRTKSLESVREKAVRKGYEHPLESLEDLVGVRVVCLLRSDLARVAAIVRSQFDVLSEDNKVDGAAIDVFGYQSVHFVVKLPGSCAGPRYAGLHDVKVELQLRTLAMDAWAALSHYLDYKSEPDVPRELRKGFFALSGLFYVADTHFELFYAERQRAREAAHRSVLATPTADQELNLDTLTAFLHKRYPDRVHADPAGVSELVGELVEAGYKTLDKLHGALDKSAAAFSEYESVLGPQFGDKRFADVGVVRRSMGLIDPDYARRRFPAGHDQMASFRKFLR